MQVSPHREPDDVLCMATSARRTIRGATAETGLIPQPGTDVAGFMATAAMVAIRLRTCKMLGDVADDLVVVLLFFRLRFWPSTYAS